MADVSGHERGQLLLVGALALAVTLVALALVLNSAIYTENLATRGSDLSGGDEAHMLQSDIRRNAGDLVQHANHKYEAYADQTSAVDDGIPTLRTLLSKYETRDGTLVSVTNPSYERGARIEQDVSGTFVSPNTGLSTWVVAGDVRARNFVATVDRPTLATDASNATRMRIVDGGADQWVVRIFNDGGTTVVQVTNPSLSTTECRDASETSTRVDFAAGTVGGSSCGAIDFFDDVSGSYDIEYVNGGAAEGTYSLIVDDTVGEVDDDLSDGTYPEPGDGQPYATDAVYSVTVELSYRTPTVEYSTEVRAVPGELDD